MAFLKEKPKAAPSPTVNEGQAMEEDVELFSLGDKVILDLDNAPVMVITDWQKVENGADECVCTWFLSDGTCQQAIFPLDVLYKAED